MMMINYNIFSKGGILIILITISSLAKAQEKTQSEKNSNITPVSQTLLSTGAVSVIHVHGSKKGNCTIGEHSQDSNQSVSFIFPNPLPQGEKGKLIFANSSTSHYTVYIFNASGSEINKTELGEDMSFYTGQLLPADYFYVIRDHQEEIVSRGRFAVK